jgi:large subunit ribosomal protein L9
MLASTSAKPSSCWSATASFVAPAAPSITRSNSAPVETTQARTDAIRRGYGLYSTKLWAKKKTAAAPKKIQVKLLKNIVGTGVYGEVIMVTPAFFSNKLLPDKAAVMITDEEVARMKEEARAQDIAANQAARAVKAVLDETTITLKRKAGPDGQLFGGIGAKTIMDELKACVKDPYLDSKVVKVVGTVDENGNKLAHDIKHIGSFSAELTLAKDVSANIAISVIHEK